VGTESILVRVIAFAGAREVLGDSLSAGVPGNMTVAMFWESLCMVHHGLRDMTSGMRFALNGKICTDVNAQLHDGDEVSLLPPVGGG
jgi:molybdopterin converting factor small subunit